MGMAGDPSGSGGGRALPAGLAEIREKRENGTRPAVRGKFLYHGDQKLHLRGVTYGTFRGWKDREDFPAPEIAERDLAFMVENGVNAFRTYTVPPSWLLDAADRHGLFVLVGLPWEQHVAFLEDRGRGRSIETRVRAGVRSCRGHPAVLAYAVGNEIPSSIARWHGRRRIERFIERLYHAAKDEDSGALVTYANYPSTEYLELPFVDFVAFNLYLEEADRLNAYLARLHNLAGDRPLVVTELGLDSRRHGERGQAVALGRQVRGAFAGGCAGAFVFAWTDEWHRGGFDVEDWDFGLTDRVRRPKAALETVREAFADASFPAELRRPRISVAVCTHNGAMTLPECLAALIRLDYPDYEILVVDDGSNDATPDLAREYGATVISTPHAGLASARNSALEAATGEIVAYLDDDAYPDPHWLSRLADTFLHTSHAGVGGPNLPPPGDGFVAECVARAPGGPQHVLLSDTEAEHIPGCNMAFRTSCLEEIGGFDPRFRVAGDDVDICWRLQERGWTLGFNPMAVVWHHRRGSLRSYMKQQREYGKAEALLERKWPEKYNGSGHVRWHGRVYGGGAHRGRWRIYYGTWGSAGYQSMYQGAAGRLASLPMLPEAYLGAGLLAAISVYEFAHEPISFAVPGLGVPFTLLLLCMWVGLLAALALAQARRALGFLRGSRLMRFRLSSVVALLHLVQPTVRMSGRLQNGLAPWRSRSPLGVLPLRRRGTFWREWWMSHEETLRQVEEELRPACTAVVRGGPFNRWDLDARVGAFGGARLRLAVEEHGQGRQLLRFRVWPRPSRGSVLLVLLLGLIACAAAYRTGPVTAIVFGVLAAAATVRIVRECAAGIAQVVAALRRQSQPKQEQTETIAAALGQRLSGARATTLTRAQLERGEV